MDCPKCVGILQTRKIEDIEVDVCFTCEGIWFDAGELEEVIKRDAHDYTMIDVGKEDYDGLELKELHDQLDVKPGKCPRCGELMLQSQYGKSSHTVHVDMCPAGHGIWLDGGEIHNLRKRHLVNIADEVEYLKDMLRYAFSKDGWNDFKTIAREKYQSVFGNKHHDDKKSE